MEKASRNVLESSKKLEVRFLPRAHRKLSTVFAVQWSTIAMRSNEDGYGNPTRNGSIWPTIRNVGSSASETQEELISSPVWGY